MARRGRRGGGWGGGWGGYAPYVPVAERRAQAKRLAAKAAKKGRPLQPVETSARKIATTFWGRAWCTNLESYGDYENRLPRGRTYVRNGSVIDLQLTPGRAQALVSGSEVYTVVVEIDPLPAERWAAIGAACAGQIESLVELLSGELSRGVMQVLTAQKGGIFPTPREIRLGCTCPDGAVVCKHVAATLYGIGVRFDDDPTLFFMLRGVDHHDLVAATAGSDLGATSGPGDGSARIAEDDLAGVFGIELDDTPAPSAGAAGRRRAGRAASRSQGASKTEPATTKKAKHTSEKKATQSRKAQPKPRAQAQPETTPTPTPSPATAAASPGTFTAVELTSLGIPRSTITYWLKRGVLAATGTRGVYGITAQTGSSLEAWFDRRG